MSLFMILSWLCCLSTSLILGFLVCCRRFLLIKPSVVFIIFFHVQVQYASAYHAAYIEDVLNQPWDYFVLVQVFPILAVLGSAVGFRRDSRLVFRRLQEAQDTSPSSFGDSRLLLLVLCTALIVCWYFIRVPWVKTGLYTILFDPENSTLAREESLKLLSSRSLKYAVSMMNSTLLPLLVAMIAVKMRWAFGSRSLRDLIGLPVLLLLCLLVVSLSGARGPAAMLLLVFGFVLWMQTGFPMRPIRLALFAGIVLLIPAALSLMRNAGKFDFATMTEFYLDMIDRVVGRTYVDGLWHVDFAQREGFWGVAGIPKLAILFDVDPVDTLNVIGRTYWPTRIASISANASSVVLMYSYFGLGSVFLSCATLWLLDMAVIIYGRLRGTMLIAAVACAGISAINLTKTFFTTVLVTHGFVAVLVVCCLLDLLTTVRKESGHALGIIEGNR